MNGTKKSNGEADVVYYSDYYPFGSPLTLAANDYRYGYQGQYAEVDKETGWNNFDLRMYDAEIGRWMSGDPYGQYHSPYLAMGNNPIMKVDPDGGLDGDPENNYKLKDGLYEGNLQEVNITAKRLTDHQVFADRMDRYNGDLSQVFSGRRGAAIEAWFNRQTYAYSLNMENEFQHGIYNAVSFYATGEIGGALFGKAIDFGKAAYLSRLASRSSGIVVEAESSSILNFTSKQLQAKFKHAADFDVLGNYSKANAAKFSVAINQHINSAAVKAIEGTYKGQNVIHYLNPNTGVNVISDISGKFVSGWKLGKGQLQGVLSNGTLW